MRHQAQLDLLKSLAPSFPEFNFAQYVLHLNECRSSKTAFVDDTGSLSYGELSVRVHQMANALKSLGIHKGERVMVLMYDNIDWPVVFLGCLYAGVVPVAVNTLFTAEDYAYQLRHSQARAVFVSDALRDTLYRAMRLTDHEVASVVVSRPSRTLPDISLAGLLEQQDAHAQAARSLTDEPAFWLYSSGSTGRPKAVVHSHANLYWVGELYGKRYLGITEKDISFSAAKLFFAYGLGNSLVFPLMTGATALLMGERPTPEAIFRQWRTWFPTVFYGAPTLYASLLASSDLPDRTQVSLRLCSSAGEALPEALGRRFSEHFGCDVLDGLGCTEMLNTFLSNAPGDVRYGASGRPVPGYLVELRDEKGKRVKRGELGDLYVCGPSSALFYWGDKTKSMETFQGRWTKMGDKYIENEDGTYTYAGRSDDMLKVSGIYVSPIEIEATLASHPAVLEAGVTGVLDKEGLCKPKASVVLKAGAKVTEQELKAFLQSRLAPYKYPRFVEFVEELPKTPTGKIQRFKLRSAAATPHEGSA